DIFDKLRGARRVEHHTRFLAQRADLGEHPMQMNRGGRFGLYQEMVGPGLGESLEITFRFDDHQMNVERLCRRTANGLQHDRPDGNVWHETSVHDVDMDPVGIGRIDGAHLLAQSREIGGQYRWCHENRLHGCYLDQGSPAAALSTNQMSSPSGLMRAAAAQLAPARIALKIGAFSLPATRNATFRLLSITG